MKIRALTNYATTFYQRKNTENNKTIQNDVFLSSNPAKKLSFGANLTFAEKFVPFRKDFLKYYMKNDILSFSEIEKIIKKYLPEMKVKNLQELENTGKINNNTCAYFNIDFDVTQNMKCIDAGQAIYVSPQNTNTLAKKIELAQAIVHETTHAMQEHSTDRLSKLDWLNSLKDIAQNKFDFAKTVQHMTSFHANVEYYLNTPLIMFMQKQNEMPVPTANAGRAMLENIYKQTVDKSVEEYIDFLVSEFWFRQEICYLDSSKQKRIFEYLVQTTAKEKEAYTNQINFAKEAMNIKTPVDLDLTKNLYSILAERSKFLANN